MIKINNYSFLKYLNYYDLIHKYNLKSIFLVPQLNNIKLKINVDQNLVYKLNVHYKIFLFYYLYNFYCSKIILNFLVNLKKKIKTMSLKSNFFLNISSKKFFDFFVNLIFFVNNKILETTYNSSSKILNTISGKPYYEHLHFIFSTSVSIFFDKLNQNQQSIKFDDLTIFFDFSIKNYIKVLSFNFFKVKKLNLYTNFFKNIFMFWALKF